MTKASVLTLLLTVGVSNAAPLAHKSKPASKAAASYNTYDLPSSYTSYGKYAGESSYGGK
jgi:hypothetical protein